MKIKCFVRKFVRKDIKIKCSVCGKKNNIQQADFQKISYHLGAKDISYDLTYKKCSNCGEFIFSHQNFLINYFIMLIYEYLNNNKERFSYYDERIKEFRYGLRTPFSYSDNIYDEVKRHIESAYKDSQFIFNIKITDSKIIADTDNYFIRNDDNHKEYNDITSCEKYLNAIKEIEKLLGTYKLWFRGQPNEGYQLIPSLFRKYDDYYYETAMTRVFSSHALNFYDKCPAQDNYAAWLVLMQHVGVPTRLLDWTESSLCALFFALHDDKLDEEHNAAVYVFNPFSWNNVHYDYPGIPYMERHKNEQMKKMIRKSFYQINEPFNQYPIAVTSLKYFDRVYNQKGNFTLHDSAIDFYTVAKDYMFKIIIPATAKKNMRKELYSMGINNTSYFPDLYALAKLTQNSLYMNWELGVK